MDKLVSKQIYIAGGIAKPLGYNCGRQPIYEGSSQSLVPPLPFISWVYEEFFITHAYYIEYDAYNVNT